MIRKSKKTTKKKLKANLAYDGIKFRSIDEFEFYKLLVAEGFDVKYEGYNFTICDSFISTFYKSVNSKNKDKRNIILRHDNKKAKSIVYTVDFFINNKWVVEYKPHYALIKEDDNLKMKIARSIIVRDKLPIVFMLVVGKGEMLQAVDIIKREEP